MTSKFSLDLSTIPPPLGSPRGRNGSVASSDNRAVKAAFAAQARRHLAAITIKKVTLKIKQTVAATFEQLSAASTRFSTLKEVLLANGVSAQVLTPINAGLSEAKSTIQHLMEAIQTESIPKEESRLNVAAVVANSGLNEILSSSPRSRSSSIKKGDGKERVINKAIVLPAIAALAQFNTTVTMAREVAARTLKCIIDADRSLKKLESTGPKELLSPDVMAAIRVALNDSRSTILRQQGIQDQQEFEHLEGSLSGRDGGSKPNSPAIARSASAPSPRNGEHKEPDIEELRKWFQVWSKKHGKEMHDKGSKDLDLRGIEWETLSDRDSTVISKGVMNGNGTVVRKRFKRAPEDDIEPTANNDRMFTEELQCLTKLQQHPAHPNIIKWLGAEFSSHSHSLAFEYCPLGSIRDLIDGGGLNEHECQVMVITQTIAALDHLHHTLGIVHRDVKADNLLMGSNGEIKLIDFGLAGAPQPNRPIRGTIRYCAPEVLMGKEESFASDIFSLGMTIYEIITGKIPFAEEPFGTKIEAYIIAGETPKLTEQDCDSVLANLCNSCLSTDPKARPTTKQLMAALEDLQQKAEKVLLQK